MLIVELLGDETPNFVSEANNCVKSNGRIRFDCCFI
jgi:hypothetical protein